MSNNKLTTTEEVLDWAEDGWFFKRRAARLALAVRLLQIVQEAAYYDDGVDAKRYLLRAIEEGIE